jgi:hypothetical protein
MVNSPYVVNKHQNTFIREMLFQRGRHGEGRRRPGLWHEQGSGDLARGRAGSYRPGARQVRAKHPMSIFGADLLRSWAAAKSVREQRRPWEMEGARRRAPKAAAESGVGEGSIRGGDDRMGDWLTAGPAWVP